MTVSDSWGAGAPPARGDTPPPDLSLCTSGFEEDYLTRAREAASKSSLGSPQGIRVDQASGGEGAIAGWWCRPDVGDRHLLLPNPWDERAAIGAYEKRAWHLAGHACATLIPILDEAHGPRSPLYWQALLAPWLMHTATVVLDRSLFLRTASRLAPDAPVIASDGVRTPETMLDSVVAYQSEQGNADLLTTMAERLGLPLAVADRRPDTAPVPSVSHQKGPLARALSHPSAALAAATSILGKAAISSRTNRRLTLVQSHYAFSPPDAVLLSRRVRGLRLSPRVSRASSPIAGSGSEHPARAKLLEATEGTGLERLLDTLLPVLLPRSVLEDYESVAAKSRRRHGAPTPLVIGNYSVDEIDNDYVGRCRADGHPVAVVQHGGCYLQLRTHAHGRIERMISSPFISWGGRAYGVEPAPIARLERLRDRHRGGDSVVLIELPSPPDRYVTAFASHPLANQAWSAPVELGDFVEAVRGTRSQLLLKEFPTSIEAAERHPAVAALPRSGPTRSPLAIEWMRRARLALITYPDTPLIEAMVLGVPLIGLWESARWEMLDDATPHFERFAELGVFFDSPTAAAARLDDVYARASEWWADPEIQSARKAFLDRFAIPGDWKARWTEILRGMQAGDVSE